jgi:hypothetical protein|tara:strand:- start:10251 stop:10454 length:204 start_codon:yes stop_codon:yes gene_type:complete
MYNIKLTGKQASMIRQLIEASTFQGNMVKDVAKVLTKMESIVIKHFKDHNEMLTHPEDPIYKNLGGE